MSIEPATLSLLPYYERLLVDGIDPETYQPTGAGHSELAIPGGKGCGKTEFATLWHFIRCRINLGFSSWWVAPDYPLAKIGYEAFCDFLRRIGWQEGVHFKVLKGSELSIELLAFKHRVFFKSANSNLEAANLSHVTFDEAGDSDPDGVRDACDRVRNINVPLRQKLFIGKPQGLNHYYQRFQMPDAQTWGEFNQFKSDGQRLVLNYRTYWNPFVGEDYVLSQLDNYGHDKQLVRSYVLGEFCPLFENAVYSFGEGNITSEPLHPQASIPTIGLSFDFNVGQLAYTAFQERDGAAFGVAEAPAKCADTDAACEAILRQFPRAEFENHAVVIDGDANGWSRDTRSRTTDYDIIRERLRPNFGSVTIRAPHANGEVRSRILATNRALSENSYTGAARKLFLSRHLKYTVDSMYRTFFDTRGQIAKPSGDTWTHRSDNVSYYAAAQFPLREHRSGALHHRG